MLLLDEKGLVQTAQGAWAVLLGQDPDRLTGSPFLDLVHPEDQVRAQPVLLKAGQGAGPFPLELRVRTSKGGWHWTQWHGEFDSASRTFSLVGRSLQDLKEAEAALEESRSKFDRLSDAAGEGVAIHEKGVVVEANVSFARLLGFERPEEVLGRNGLDFVAPEFRELVTQQIRSGSEEPYEIVGIRRDGTRFNTLVQGRAMQYQGRSLRVATFLDITRSKKREQELFESQELFRKLADASKDGIAVSEKGVILMANPALARMLGRELPELIGRNALEFTAPEFRETILQHMTEESEATYEIMGLRSDGLRFPVEITPRMTTYQGRRVRLVYFRDITQRKRIEEEVVRQKEFTQNLINSSVDGLLAFDHECRYTLWNPAMERISGHSREECIGQVAFDVFPFLKQIGEDVHFYAALKGESPVTQERPYRTPAGRQGYFEAYYMPVKNAKGEILGGLGIVRDVTERRRVSEALRQSEANLQAVFNNTFQNIVLVDREGRIRAFNNNALLNNRQWTGQDLKAGGSIVDFVSEGNKPLFRARFQKALQGEVVTHEQRYHKGGEEQWLEVSYNPVFGDQGEIEGVCLIATNVIERKMAEEALQKSEADLRAIFESSHQSLVLVGKDGRIRDFNRRALEGLKAARGMQLEKGRAMADYVEPEHLEDFRKRFQLVLEGKVTRIERSVRAPDGTVLWFDFHYYPVLDHMGQVQGACMVADSIDERKKAEAIIRESEEKFRRVFEDAAMPMAMVSDFRYLKVNRAFRELLGYEEKEILGRHLLEITHPEDRTESDKISREVHRGEQDRFESEKRYLRKNGESVWVHLFGTLIRDPQGQVLYSLVLVENIQERKLAQEALRRSEADLRAVFDNVDQAVVLLTPEGRIQSFNPRAEESFRMATDKELRRGNFFRDYIRPADMGLYEASFKKALEGQRMTRERAYRTPDGVEHWFEFGYYPVPGADGKVAGICFVSQRIDERKKAEEDLRRSEAELRAVFNSGSQVMVLINPDGTIQDFNQFAAMMAQRVQGKALTKGMKFVETLPRGASEDQFHESFQAALAGKENKAERAIRDARGQERWVEVRYQPALNPAGGVEAVCFSLTFIDERKKAEEALRESQERFERFALVTNEGILLHENPRVVDANPALAHMLGYEVEEMIGRPGFDFIAPESHPIARKHMVSGSSQPYEVLALRKDGSTFPVELRGRNFPFKGRDLRVMSVRDMTWNKAAERILTESEERYRRLVELSPDAVVVHSGGEILYVNPAGLELFGGQGRDLREVQLADFLHPETREKAMERVRRIQETGEPTDWMEQKLRRLDGGEFFGETKGTPFLFKGVPAVLTIVRDVTERHRSQQTLLRYERLAAVGKVIAAIAHEVRNPLAVLTGMIQLMNAKMEGRKEYSQELKTILSQAERLRFFMNDILDYSKELEIRKSPVDLEVLLQESLTAAQAQVGGRADLIRVEMPVGKKWAVFSADRDRLQQVLVNLLTNAYQAVGEKGSLKLGARQTKAETRLTVEDDGPGIGDTEMSHLFEPFFTTKKGGSGLGLSISQKIVEAHGGRIELERLRPHGTRFTVVLPRKD